MRSIAWLGEIDEPLLARVGGKARNLAELELAGMPVPPAFVVTTDAYRAHLEHAGLAKRIAVRVEGCDLDNFNAVDEACNDIRTWIGATPLPEPVALAIAKAYREFPGEHASPRVAVRSSASAEDGADVSFAGQHETLLNVRGEGELLDAVRRCWTSLWTPRALVYRSRFGFDLTRVDVAAVVQLFVPAETAGVLFTTNPLSGNSDEILITGSYGLGEAVVGGLVTPDTVVLDAKGSITERRLGTKEIRVVPAESGTQVESVEVSGRRRFCFTPADLKGLNALGRRAAAHFGAPQDIEWARAGGHLYILQSRPITVTSFGYVGPKLSPLERWSLRVATDNNRDHWPEPLKPLDAAIYRVATSGMAAWFREFGAHVRADRRYYEELPDKRVAIRPLALTPRLPMVWRIPRRILRAFKEDPHEAWAGLKAEVLRVIEPWEATETASLEPERLAQGIEQTLKAVADEMPLRFSRIFTPGQLHESLVRVWCRMALGAEEGAEAAQALFDALPYRTAEMNRDVARLARILLSEGKESPTLDAALESFLAEWGSRPIRGMEAVPSVPTWRDDPTIVLGLIDAMAHDPTAIDVDGSERRQAERYAVAQERVAARLKGRRRHWFLHSVDTARRAIIAREDSLHLHERASALVRRLALSLGERLVGLGALDAAEDVFFLYESELSQAARGDSGLRERIIPRRRAYQRVVAAHRRGENWFVASGSLPEEVFARSKETSDVLLKGLAASRGVVAGRVCIITDQSEFERFRSGDILVAPITTPAWTPLFRLASGVVTDVGGLLSHAAIVAREYGVPAVLGVGNATRRLQEGEAVTVDGTAGVVRRSRDDR